MSETQTQPTKVGAYIRAAQELAGIVQELIEAGRIDWTVDDAPILHGLIEQMNDPPDHIVPALLAAADGLREQVELVWPWIDERSLNARAEWGDLLDELDNTRAAIAEVQL
jgi:hypothetical protein